MIHGPLFDAEKEPNLNLAAFGQFVPAQRGGKSLNQLWIDGMETPQNPVEVPHSRPIVFEQPLRMFSYLSKPKESPAIFVDLLQNWRALVTLIALSEMNRYDVRMQRVNLSEAARLTAKRRDMKSRGVTEDEGLTLEAVEAALRRISEFEKLVAISQPHQVNASFQGANWDDIYLLYYNYHPEEHRPFDSDAVIGILSPLTAVCPIYNEGFRSLLKKINNGDKFNFIKYDKSFADAFTRDGSDFGEQCTRLFREQFARFTPRELKAVLEWIRKVKPYCVNETNAFRTSYHLFNDFEQLLLSFYPGTQFSRPWQYTGSCFQQNYFISPEMLEDSPFRVLNFSARDIPLRREWHVAFIILALRDVRHFSLVAREGDIGYERDGETFVPLFHADNFTLLEPVKDLCAKLPESSGFNFPVTDEDEYDFNDLSPFERECVVQWLDRLKEKVEVSENGQLSDYIDLLDKKLRKDLYKITENVLATKKISPWLANRFVTGALNLTDKRLALFDAYVQRDIAAFFEDYSGTDQAGEKVYGVLHDRVVNGWFATLESLTFSRMSQSKVVYEPVPTQTEATSDLYTASEYQRYAIKINGVIVAFTNRSMLFNTVKLNDTLTGSAERETIELLLFAVRLRQLRDRLTATNNRFISIGATDASTLLYCIDKKILALREACYRNSTDEFQKHQSVVAPFYPIEEDPVAAESKSTLRFITDYAADHFFAEKLLFTADEKKPYVSIYNDENKKDSIYAVKELDEDRNIKSDSKGCVLLPWTDMAVKALYGRLNRDAAPETTRWYGVRCINAYCSKASYDMETRYTIEIQLADLPFPFVKTYVGDKDIVSFTDIEKLPDILVWPNVEITGWNAYYLSSVSSTESEDAADVELPTIVYGSDIKKRNNYEHTEKGEIVTVPTTHGGKASLHIKTDELGNFPYFVKVTYNGGTGYLLVPSRNEKGDSYLDPAEDDEAAILCVDFGTTNTTAWVNDGSEDQFDAKHTNSLSLLHKLVGNDLIIHRVAAQHSSEQNTAKSDPILNTALLLYGGAAAFPFLHANIYRLEGRELTDANGFLTRRGKNQQMQFNMKWDTDREDVRTSAKLFLIQFGLMCCKLAVERKLTHNIDLRVSFPSGQYKTIRDIFPPLWQEVVGELRSLTGLDITNAKFYTESYCSGLVPAIPDNTIYDHPTTNDYAYVCVDIGGGTTDVSIFYKDGLPRVQTSLPFAGRLFLSGAGFKGSRPDIIRFFQDINQKLIDAHENLKGDLRDKLADYRLKLEGYKQVYTRMGQLKSDKYETPEFILLTDLLAGGMYEVFERIRDEGGGFQNKTFSRFLRDSKKDKTQRYLARIKFGLSALAFFIGKVVRVYHDKGDAGGIRFAENMSGKLALPLYFAGNGSKILDWYMYNGESDEYLHGATANTDAACEAVFKEYIKKGFYQEVTDGRFVENTSKELIVTLSRSKKPKLEASLGLSVAKGPSQMGSADSLDSLAPIHIQQSLRDMTPGDLEDHLERCLTKLGYKDTWVDTRELHKLLENDRKTVQDTLVKLVNPGHDLRRMQTEILGFLSVFKTISRNDWALLYSGLDIDTRSDMNDEKNRPVNEKIGDQTKRILEAISSNANWISMPMDDYTPYVILEYATAILNGTI